jgi:hypothetical protein
MTNSVLKYLILMCALNIYEISIDCIRVNLYFRMQKAQIYYIHYKVTSPSALSALNAVLLQFLHPL